SQGTMRRALITLEAEGLLNRKPGRGTLVAAPEANPQAGAAPALTDATGGAPGFELHRARTESRRAEAAEADRFCAGRRTILDRLLKRAGRRAALETILVPVGLIAAPDEAAPHDLGGFLAVHDIEPHRITTRSTARLTTMTEAVTLNTDRATALLTLTSVAYDSTGACLATQSLRIVDPDLGYG
ncbi:MAG: UTRA domain-containing protein, partial [Pseudomonadota bacterium]